MIEIELTTNEITVETQTNEINVSLEKQGARGVGVPEGGNIGQVLAKKSDDDFDTEWQSKTSLLSTDELPEGENNLYFTEERGREAVEGLYDDKGTAEGLVGAHEEEFNHSLIATALQSETDPIFSSWLLNTPPLYSESDPIFSAWLLNTPPIYSETDPIFSAWDKSTGISITESQISDFKTYIQSSEKGANNGVATLDAGGKVPTNQLPSTLLIYKGVWNATTNTPTLLATDTTKKGFVYNVAVVGTQFGIEWKLGDWAIYNDSGVLEKSDNSDDVVSVNGQQGVVVLGKSDVGLGNVDNTSDLNKPISTSTQSALDLKWSLDGNTLGAKKTLGSIDNQDFGIITNNTERVTVLKNGNVGIGTSAPLGLLHIEGNNPVLTLRATGAAVDNKILYLQNAGGRFDISKANDAYNTFTQLVSILNNGNVGIGTTNPGAKFTVRNTTSDTPFNIGMALTNMAGVSNDSLPALVFAYNNVGNNIFGAIDMVRTAGSGADMRFYSNASVSASPTERMRIQGATGYVGIGTTNPISSLHIETTGTSTLRIQTSVITNGQTSNLEFGVSSNRGLTSSKISSIRTDVGGSNSADLAFYTSLGTVSNERLRILANGNVGIGTTSPSTKLQVNGEITKGSENSIVPGITFTQIADKTIGNTTTETTMFATGVGSLTIPANSLVAGRTYRIKLKGYASGTNGDTSTIKVKLGTTELVSSTGTWQTLTDIGFTLEFDFTCRTTGATGTVAGSGYSLVSGGQGFSTVSMRALLAGTDTLNTTVNQVIDLTYQWSDAKTGNTVTITNASVEVLN